MKNIIFLLTLLGLFLLQTYCSNESKVTEKKGDILLLKTDVSINSNFIGNGAQWGGYDLLIDWTGSDDFSEEDWLKLKQRVDFMRPPFVRIMIDANWNYITSDNTYDQSKTSKSILRILEYCTQNNITVMFGEWGHKYLNNSISQINEEWMTWSADYLKWLVEEQGFACIKYFNMVNEPNGYWSSTNTNYELWQEIISKFQQKLSEKGLANQVKIVGPDVAVWDVTLTYWVSNAANDLKNTIELFDIHTYPEQSFVRGSSYMELLEAYRDRVPTGKQIIMGEIGFKYTQNDEQLKNENQTRILNDPYASDDSNMFIYDAFYGIDMSDAIIQCMMAGYGGSLVWDMDDAMYNSPDYDAGEEYNAKKLKRWGFWNILGQEVCNNAQDEEIRPFFYPVSLLCRYFPAGAEIYQIDLPDKKGLRAVAAKKDENYTIAIVNSNYTDYESLILKADSNFMLNGVKKYVYKSIQGIEFFGKTDNNGFPLPQEDDLNIDLENGYPISLEGQSVIIFTNFLY